MNKQIAIVIVMVAAMLFFMVSIVGHFTNMSQVQKEQEAAYKDSLVQAQIEQLTNTNIVLKEAIRSQEVRLDQLKSKVDNVNYKVNLIMN